MNAQSLLTSIRKNLFASAKVAPMQRKSQLRVETLEAREVPATLPAPVIDESSIRSIQNNAFAPFLVADPTNPNKLFSVFVTTTPGSTDTNIGIRFSTNAGASYSFLAGPDHAIDPKAAADSFQAGPLFTNVGNPTAAMDRFGRAYVTWVEKNLDGTSGRLVVARYDFSGGAPNFLGLSTVYRWADSDEIYNPYIAVNTNVANFQDPDVGGVAGQQTDALAAAQTNSASTRVFLIWNTNNEQPQDFEINPNVIRMAVSDDGATTFGPAVVVNDSNNAGDLTPGSTRLASPKIMFTQGRAGDLTSGGAMVTMWTDTPFNLSVNDPATIVSDLKQYTSTFIPNSHSSTVSTNTFITDALPPPPNTSGPDQPQTTTVNIPVTGSNITKIDAIDLTLNIHTDDLSHYRISLISPTGTRRILVNNGVDSSGNDTFQGIDGTELGTYKTLSDVGPNGFLIGTTFADHAPRNIVDPSAGEPYHGSYRAEGGSLITAFGGLTAGQINGNWQLEIIDFRDSGDNPQPVPTIRGVTLRLSQNVQDETRPKAGLFAGYGDEFGTGAAVLPDNFTGTNYLSKPSYSPNAGEGPGFVIASDRTLGAFSPSQNRIYVTYNSYGSINLRYSDDLGQTWSVPTAVGGGFLPQMTVDQTTGTVLVSYMSAQFDAAGVRSATMLATSINGPIFTDDTGTLEFSAPQYVNASEYYYDQIRSSDLKFEPVTSNGAQNGPEGYGNNMGLVSFNGRVNLLYAGNLNRDNTQIRTQNMTIAAGPRVVIPPGVAGSQGPILADAIVQQREQIGTVTVPIGTITFNNSTFTDGRRMFDAFVIEFDRVIDPSTFTPADVVVKYRDPDDDPITGGIDIIPTSITALDDIEDPLDNSDYGSKRFLVRIPAQSGVGTYSYVVKGDVSDRVRGQTISTTFDPLETFTRTHAPALAITDATGGNTTPVVSTLFVVPTSVGVIRDITVTVNITHPRISDLSLVLVSPAGDTVVLVPNDIVPDTAANYTGTQFSLAAADTLATTLDVAPYTGSYRAFGDLNALVGTDPFGAWQLVVTDNAQTRVGTINSWSLDLTFKNETLVSTNGNLRDQDGDGVENEPTGIGGQEDDWFAQPAPLGGVPFQQPYASGSLPVIVTGPRVINSQTVGSPNNPLQDNLALNTTVTALDVQFDRVMSAASFTKDDVLRITGPLGDIPLTSVTVTPVSGLDGTPLAAGTNSAFFRIGGFGTQRLAGSYRVQLGANISDTTGNLMDKDEDAGLSNLQGDLIGAPVDLRLFGGTPLTTALPGNSQTTINLSVAEAFLVRRAQVNLSLTHPRTRDLEARLIAPDGTTVLLFANSPATGSDDAQTAPPGGFPEIFTNITLTDNAFGTPIQSGGTSNGSFTPIQPLAQMNSKGAFGNWRLVIRNKGTTAGQVQKFQLLLDRAQAGTGLGETVADQTSVGFRIFLSDGINLETAKDNWTPIGPIGRETIDAQGRSNDGTVGRVSSIAVDPSDPTGNTVYVAGASGGVWRTTNFLTRNPNGPNYVPLTDFGPNNAINVGTIALFPDPNGDPLKTTILVGTGSDSLNDPQLDRPPDENYRFDGVGFLLSEDAGKTWEVLDSLNNYDTATNKYRPITDTLRNHQFVGAVINKIIVEPQKNSTNNRPVFYAAVGQGSAAAAVAGLYRSLDGGRNWTKLSTLPAGDVSDVVFGEGSALTTTGNRPRLAYVAVEGEGIYFTQNLNSPNPAFTLMPGGVGRPQINSGGVGTDAPAELPNGGKSKIVLASPKVVSGDFLANNYYQFWLYAAVSNADGSFDGLYATKDGGSNWTKIPILSDIPAPTTFTDGGGNHSLSIAIDPNNPNIVYVGSDSMVRFDTTFINDPYNLSLYQYSNPDGGAIRPLTSGGAVVTDTTLDDNLGPAEDNSGLLAVDPNTGNGSLTPHLYPTVLGPILEGSLRGVPRARWNFVNLVRDPYQPFRSDSTLFTTNVDRFLNTGNDVTASGAGFEPTQNFSWVTNIVTTIDPLTGKARILYGTDEGLATFVNNEDGSLNSVIGYDQPDVNRNAFDPPTTFNDSELQVNDLRNGDLQIARLYSGDVQPSLLAANISRAFAIGAGRRVTDIESTQANILSTGDVEWRNSLGTPPAGPRIGPANYVETDKFGDGLVFILRRIDDMTNPTVGDVRSNFFQVQFNGGIPEARTGGSQSLFRNPADANGSNSQWDNSVKRFAVNPINTADASVRRNSYGIVIGSAEGRVYRSVDTGLNWQVIGEPAVFGGSQGSAYAFGAPLSASDADNDYIYVGTTDGKMFVTTTGGGDATRWTDISAGLPAGDQVWKIVPNPDRNAPATQKYELFAVTDTGVFYMPDWTATGATWVNITANLTGTTAITHDAFSDVDYRSPLLTTTPNAAQLMTIAVDWRPRFGNVASRPIIYAGGDGGVFRATLAATPATTTWIRFPATAEGASSPGGGLPVVKVTDLDLSIGNIDPQTGRPKSGGVANMLVATTLGRGSFAIALGATSTVGQSGPRVTGSLVQTVAGGVGVQPPVDYIELTFDKEIDVASFDSTDVVVKDPVGNTLPTSNYTVTVRNPGVNTVFRIDFVPNLVLNGTYSVTVGPNVTDGPNVIPGSGNKMNQDADAINGEATQDQFKLSVTIGTSDVVDFVNDTYLGLLGRVPTAAELAAVAVTNMTTTRNAFLPTVARTLLLDPVARQRLVERTFRITGGADREIGNLLPTGFTLSVPARDFIVNEFVAGRKSPETLIVETMTGMKSATLVTDVPGLGNLYYTQNATGATPTDQARNYLRAVYRDLFRLTPGLSRIEFDWLRTTDQNAQISQVATAAGRFNLVNSLLRTLKPVYYFEGGVTTTPQRTIYVRDWVTRLAYAKYVNRTINYVPATPTTPVVFTQFFTTAEQTNGRSLLAVALAANQLQGSERLLQKVLGSAEFFSLQIQATGPDAGLNTGRGWVAGVFAARYPAPATSTQLDTFSQQILDSFKTRRDAFVKSVVNSNAADGYREKETDFYFNLIYGVGATQAEKNAWKTSLNAGSAYATLLAGQLATSRFFVTGNANNLAWANQVFLKLGVAGDANVLAAAATANGRSSAVLSLVLNGTAWRDVVIQRAFARTLGVSASPAELSAYRTFLGLTTVKNKWELIVVDILANGAAIPGANPTLPRRYWEVLK